MLSTSYIDIWFRFNPFLWKQGLVIPAAADIPVTRRVIYTLCGPLASIAIASLAIYLAFRFDSHSAIKYFLIVFFCSALIDLFINIIPSTRPVKLYDGRIVYNDGYQIRWLLRLKMMERRYDRAIAHFNNNEFKQASDLLDDRLLKIFDHVAVFRVAIAANVVSMRYTKALELHIILSKKDQLTYLDHYYLGVIKTRLDGIDESLDAFKMSLELKSDNFDCLANIGYILNLRGEFEEAIIYFDKAIAMNPQFAYAYSNRGLSQIKLNRIDKGLEDINKSLLIDPGNSYAYRNRGIYYKESGQHAQALEDLHKARELDKHTHLIDELIDSIPAKNSA